VRVVVWSVIAAAVLYLAAADTLAQAPSGNSQANPQGAGVSKVETDTAPLLGGIDIPAAFRPRRGSKLQLQLYRRPSEQSSVVLTVTSVEMLDTFSLGDGALVAAVYGRTQRWNRLRLLDGRGGWLAPVDAGKYVSLERLLETQSSLHSANWDRVLLDAPRGERQIVLKPDPRAALVGWLRVHRPDEAIDVFAAPNQQPLTRLTPSNSAERLATLNYLPVVFSETAGWIEVGLETDSSITRSWGKRGWLVDDPARWTVVRDVEALELSPAGGYGFQVLEKRYVKGALWLRVKVFADDECYQSLFNRPEIELGEGWIPAHAANGRPTFWFEIYCD
jgi:hypothetical protein